MYGQPVFWRETMKPARFLLFDIRITVVLFPAFMHVRVWTLLTALAVMCAFIWLERKGVSMDASLRYLRARIVGRRRSARGPSEERLPVDFGYESEAWLQRERLRLESENGTFGRKPSLATYVKRLVQSSPQATDVAKNAAAEHDVAPKSAPDISLDDPHPNAWTEMARRAVRKMVRAAGTRSGRKSNPRRKT